MRWTMLMPTMLMPTVLMPTVLLIGWLVSLTGCAVEPPIGDLQEKPATTDTAKTDREDEFGDNFETGDTEHWQQQVGEDAAEDEESAPDPQGSGSSGSGSSG